MSFTVTDCTVTTNSITIKFSDTVLSGNADPHGGDNPANYALFAANSVDFTHTPPETIKEVIDGQPAASAFKVTTTFSATGDSVTFKFTPRSGRREFEAGEFVHVVVRNVQSTKNEDLDGGVAVTGGVVQGRIGRLTRDVEDAISYPILTEEIGYRPSPVGIPTGGGMPGAGSAGGLGQVAAKAVSEVLGWKPNVADPKGFVGALTQSFNLADVEGRVE